MVKPPPSGDSSQNSTSNEWWIPLAFFASGFAALIYQVVWQRVLFAGFGINIEAVTIVVTAFLAGLGIGSLLGGQISARRQRSLLVAFGVVELTISAYGIISVNLFRWLAGFASGLNQLSSGALTFFLVLIPTVMMGFTLPLLAEYSVRRSGNVGFSVGQLYFVNTAGSALSSLMAAAFMMGSLGEWKSVAVAASVNMAVGVIALANAYARKHNT